MHKVIILAIGNELLIGETLDTNTNWLCRQLTSLGGNVIRAVMMPDEPEVIVTELRRALELNPDLIITTGGLGPTDDDLTLASIAQALELPLKSDPIAYQWVADKFKQLVTAGFVSNAEMLPGRAKMAQLPAGSEPINNPVGSAPAMLLKYNNTAIISLPGVPTEMKGFFNGPLQPMLLSLFGAGSLLEQTIWAGCGDESELAPILRAVTKQHPAVYIKSKAQGYGPAQQFRIILHARGQAEVINSQLLAAVQSLAEALTAAGIKVLAQPIEPEPAESATEAQE